MEWTSHMRAEEDRLKAMVDALGRRQGRSFLVKVERMRLERSLRKSIAETRLFLDDCLSGRNSYEQHLMEYRIRVEFPIFSHLESIFSLAARPVESLAVG
jgi:hypothetical protein